MTPDTPEQWLALAQRYARLLGLQSEGVYPVITTKTRELVGLYSRELGWLWRR